MLNNPVILVCSDLSENSDHILKAAEQLRKKTNGRIHLLHVWEYPLQWDWVEPNLKQAYLNDTLRQEIHNGLEQRAREQIQRCEVQASFEVVNGIVDSCITETAAQQKAKLLVIGHKGKVNNPFHLGGHASKLIASSTIPVLVVKGPLQVERIAALVDTNEVMKAVISAAEELSFLFSSQIEVVSLWKETFTQYFNMTSLDENSKLLRLTKEEQELVLDKMQSKIRSVLDPHSKATIKVAITSERQVAYHLLDILKKDQTNLVVMERHQKGRLEKLLIGSETRRMLELFPGNLLILPPSV